ncbi:MAG: hypothetical protein Kilf2KO_01070 [Rhodospirillales bacterium]
MSQTTDAIARPLSSLLPNLPLVIWMVLIALVLGLAGGMNAAALIEIFNSGFGRALGEFALILLPSFALAAAMARQDATAVRGLAAAASPVAGAGMTCPDTAYAALSPIGGRHKLEVAFGSYAGFKLLYPAGPLIVATGLGVSDESLALYGAALVIPVWAVGTLWARIAGAVPPSRMSDPPVAVRRQAFKIFAPFGVLAGLLVVGALNDFAALPLLDFATQPKGALLLAAIWALLGVAGSERRACLESATRRSGSLLLIIGAASAFGAVLTSVLPLGGVFAVGDGVLGIVGLFALTTLFKLAQGSSMATFAAVAPVAAPLVAAAGLSPVAAVFAICLGSFIAILPNDSFYWLVRRDALAQLESEGRAMAILTGGAVLQALTGLILLVAAMLAGLL